MTPLDVTALVVGILAILGTLFVVWLAWYMTKNDKGAK